MPHLCNEEDEKDGIVYSLLGLESLPFIGRLGVSVITLFVTLAVPITILSGLWWSVRVLSIVWGGAGSRSANGLVWVWRVRHRK